MNKQNQLNPLLQTYMKVKKNIENLQLKYLFKKSYTPLQLAKFLERLTTLRDEKITKQKKKKFQKYMNVINIRAISNQ